MSIEAVADLLRRGKEAVINNDYSAGRTLLTQVVQLDPQNEQGWLWLSGLLNNPDRMRFCLERVIQINPENVHAQAALNDLERKARGGRVSERLDVGSGPRSIPRRPASMVEGAGVAALAQTHNRIRWSYIGLWSLIWALHLILWRRQVAGPQLTLGVVALSALLLATAQSGAWIIFVQLIRRTQATHTLRRTTINDAISMALWPSGMLALAGLLVGAWMQGSDASMSAVGDVLKGGLLLSSVIMLLRGLLTELAPALHERPARKALGRAFLAFVGCWAATLFIGWNLLSTLLGA